MITIKKISDYQGWNPYAEEWNNLLTRSSSNHIFLTFEWLSTWWELFGEDKELAIILAFDGKQLVGAVPLFLERARVLKVLRFLGSQVVMTDLLNFIVIPGREREVIPALMDFLLNKVSWDKMYLNDMMGEPKILDALKKWSEGHNFIFSCEKNFVSPCLHLSDTLEGFHKKVDSAFLKGLQRTGLRRLYREHQVEFQDSVERDEIDRTLEKLFQLHTERWEAEGKKGQFDTQIKKNFYKKIALKMSSQGWLRLAALRVDGNEEAVLLGVEYLKSYFALQLGCGLRGLQLKAGNVLFYRLLESLIGRVNKFHFLKGNEGYKYKWGATDSFYTINLSVTKGWKGKGRYWVGQALRKVSKK
jgi:CelD/BcsL family acetyltransferase involved in cellulose biosynthesis